MADLLFQWIDEITGTFFLLGFFAHLAVTTLRKERLGLDVALARATSAMLIPSGIAMLVCAFKPEYVTLLSDRMLPFLAAGSALILTGWRHCVSR